MLGSDQHSFVGRIYHLSVGSMHFDCYDNLARHADCKYAFHVNEALTNLVRRVESLNMVGSMLWPKGMPKSFKDFPVSRYEWLNISADVFLARYISVVDCALILTNEVFEAGLAPQSCTYASLKKKSVPPPVLHLIQTMIDDQGALRQERNSRLHHGAERRFSSDDQTPRMVALFEHRNTPLVDEHRRPLPIERLFLEGLAELQEDFNVLMRLLVKRLDRLYDLLEAEFEPRFSPKFAAGPFGDNGRSTRNQG